MISLEALSHTDTPVINAKYDGLLSIATGRSRKETSWRNRELLWSELVNRLSQTQRTHETWQEYIKSPKPRQDEIKDVGGFVGGYVTGGRRKAGSIANRHILTLDIDFGTRDAFDDFVMFYGCACVLYSTHKHGPGQFRGRLIIPLNRPVFRDEYQAVGRKVAESLGIEQFDDTTFQPERLMYWPSTAKDGEWVFDFYDGPFLDADEVLAVYRDWRDVSEWPVSVRAGKIIERETKKQGDPLEKPGLIGAFCRVYDIPAVIEAFLPDVYEPCDNGSQPGFGRYSYKEGTTTAGLVVYEDKYAYSHHGTDPVGGKLCNAFDLVRLHKYGLRDEDAKPGTAPNRLPSFTAMSEFASRLPEVRRQITTEKLADASADFADCIPADEATDEAEDDSWKGKLDVDRKGNLHATINNVIVILENDPALKHKFTLNDFRHEYRVGGALPWRAFNPEKPYFTDTDDAGLRYYFENVYGIEGIRKIEDGVKLTFEKQSYHPVRDYLNALSWDGVARLDTLLIDYLGAADTPYIRAVTRKAFTAAVARIRQPGVKFDYVLTLIGPQGVGKSTLLKKMGREWFSDSFTTIVGKEAYEQIQGVWIVELGELASLKKAEIETVKHFITKQEDIFRLPYGHRPGHFPRQCAFFATTNLPDFLKDPTGGRRWWPVDVAAQAPLYSVHADLNDAVIGQLWAEAVYRHQHGETLYLPPSLETQARYQQDTHAEDNGKVGLIQAFLDKPIPAEWYVWDIFKRRNYIAGDELLPDTPTVSRDKVCVAEIWFECFGGDLKHLDRIRAAELKDAMRKVEGWEEYDLDKDKGRLKFGAVYGRQKAYVRTTRTTIEKDIYD